ncbi:carboxymuconolactone decarboxylase family protein [Celeribacter halophilus]|uniref:carboxymuconolactone decarboxylase family protein n=1 Tax=Celeribacter halophilus TaxID=576117 RepID=UPI001C0851E4|nr:carboxymuconolactone decarboxylase family protein [Celeribacter halophilus]MBU2888836.1 carboxymuconolactone decarboxylase family protein [Celeribacter halophilus]MDO6511833.1 carboxymuconolactone decarboxylase family protein [Celeribacter halophilus]
MGTTHLFTDADVEANPEVKAVFEDIRATRGSDFVNNIWRALAADPKGLKRTWENVKSLMAAPGALDPKTREMIYIAVSIANGCSYCVHSHTAAAKAKGMSEDEHGELMQIVALAASTNHLVTALQVPIDPEFEVK